MKKLLLGIDQGTSGLKMTLFKSDGEVVVSVTKSYKTYYPGPNQVEQNCEDWWLAIKSGLKVLLGHPEVEAKQIVGIGIDGISWSCIPIDKSGNVLYPTMIWLDRRASKETKWMKEVCGEEALIQASGNPIDAAYITPKILWLKNNKPDIYNQTDQFLQSNSYLVYKLTAQFSQDVSQGYGYHFFDIKTGQYNESIVNQLGLSLDKFPDIYACHDIVGSVTEDVALETGLLVGTPVVAGGLDAACCTLGAGVLKVGQTQEQGGQAGGMSIVTETPSVHPNLILGYHVVPDLWLLQGGTTGGGGTLRWFHQEFKTQTLSNFESLSEAAKEAEIGCGGITYLPYMKGERSPIWNTKAKGVFYGLSFESTQKDIIRSIMEGVAFSLMHNLNTALEVDVDIDGLISVGGSSNSEIWTQIKADVTNQVIEVPYSDHATALGAAILAGIGCGVYDTFSDAVEKTVKIRRVHQPNIKDHLEYKQHYDTYMKLSHLMNEHMWL